MAPPQRKKRGPDVLPRGKRNRPPSERFWEKVDKSGECWNWMGSTTNLGYAEFYFNATKTPAHRFAYEDRVGPIPDGYLMDHLCRTPSCVNPDHLEAVTHRENVLRGTSPAAECARKTHCKRGHPFAADNLLYSGGQRHCRACMRERKRAAATY